MDREFLSGNLLVSLHSNDTIEPQSVLIASKNTETRKSQLVTTFSAGRAVCCFVVLEQRGPHQMGRMGRTCCRGSPAEIVQVSPNRSGQRCMGLPPRALTPLE